MMRFVIFAGLLVALLFAGSGSRPPAGKCGAPEWGFFAHKRINRLAVFLLPPDMMVFFKKNIDWISDHAVDADMRRYATKNEAPRHYIDLDLYGDPPYGRLPRLFPDALQTFTTIYAVNRRNDTLVVYDPREERTEEERRLWRRFFATQVARQFHRADSRLHPDTLRQFMLGENLPPPSAGDWRDAFFVENLSEHGIVPWHLQKMQRDLTAAFRNKDSKRILRLAADLGHYIGDAHVPLHTTSNYNGQKTNQHGIHAFWESRIPELFADKQYDYFVGKAYYVNDPVKFFWDMVLASNSMVDSVLNIEWSLRQSYPKDRQICPTMRNGVAMLAPCPAYAAAYQEAMNGMVERRMRSAILSLASAWYTAWVDAGQPNLSRMDEPVATAEQIKEDEEVRNSFGRGQILGRPEEH